MKKSLGFVKKVLGFGKKNLYIGIAFLVVVGLLSLFIFSGAREEFGIIVSAVTTTIPTTAVPDASAAASALAATAATSVTATTKVTDSKHGIVDGGKGGGNAS